MAADRFLHPEVQYRHLFESAQDGILVVDARSGRITDANPSIAELLEYTRPELLGKQLGEIGLITECEATESDLFSRLSASSVRYTDLPVQTRRGRLRHVELVCGLIVEGDVKVIQCNVRDITERRRQEQLAAEELWASEETLRRIQAHSGAVIQNALDCIIIIDHENQVTEFNPAAAATFGYTRTEALGKDLDDLIIPHRLHAAHRQGIAHYLKTGEGPVLNRRIEVPARRKDGAEITVELTATAIENAAPPNLLPTCATSPSRNACRSR